MLPGVTPPPMSPAPHRLQASWRALGGFVSLGALGVLTIASALRPSADGHGTHTQLGMPECAWTVTVDLPCPTCGMTTSFAHAAGGDLLASMQTQPMGLVLVIGTAAAFWAGLHALVAGVRLGPVLGTLTTRRAIWALATAAVGAWVYKIITWG